MIFQIFGQISPPYKGSYNIGIGKGIFGMVSFINNALGLVFIIGGLFVFLNLIVAAFQFLNSGGDPKAIEQAWNKIWQSLVGLFILVSSFIIASLAGYILFGQPNWLLHPVIYGPD